MNKPERAPITVQDCEELYRRFIEYTETAEQHEFPLLAAVNVKLDVTMQKLRQTGVVEDQKDIRAMFRVVLKTIGEDFSAYQEETERNTKKPFPEKTVFVVVQLIPEEGKKTLEIATFSEDTLLDKLPLFFNKVKKKCIEKHAYIGDFYSFRSQEEWEAHKQRIQEEGRAKDLGEKEVLDHLQQVSGEV